MSNVEQLATRAARMGADRRVVNLIRQYATTERTHLARIDEEERLKINALNRVASEENSKDTLAGLLLRVMDDPSYESLDSTLRADIEANVG